MTEQEHIGQVIKRLREERGLSKARLAREAYISDAYLVQIEQQRRTPSEKVLRQLARAMRIPATVLLIPAALIDPDVLARAEAHAEQDADYYREVYGHDPSEEVRQIFVTQSLAQAEADVRSDYHDEGDYRLNPDLYYEEPGAEGWHDLSKKDQRLVQQLINRLRHVESEDE